MTEYWALIIDYLPGYLMPCLRTVVLSAIALLLSVGCGLVGVLGRRARHPLLHLPADFYVWFMRGTPALIQVYLVYYSLPEIGIVLSPEVAGVLALGVSSGAYMTEIFRSGFQAIPKGQVESSTAIGMGPVRGLRRIILPQVFRIVLPAMTNEAMSILKTSSLLSIITVYEITLHTQAVIAETFMPLEFYLISSVCYLVLADLISRLSEQAESRFAWSV